MSTTSWWIHSEFMRKGKKPDYDLVEFWRDYYQRLELIVDESDENRQNKQK